MGVNLESGRIPNVAARVKCTRPNARRRIQRQRQQLPRLLITRGNIYQVARVIVPLRFNDASSRLGVFRVIKRRLLAPQISSTYTIYTRTENAHHF